MTPELLNKLKHLANIAAHLPHDVTLEDEDVAMKALHGELAADTVLQMIALAESALLAAAPAPIQQEPEGMEDPIMIPRGLVGAACYLIRKHAPESNLLEKLRDFTTGKYATRPALAGSQVQAAGDVPWRVAEFWSSANPGKKCLMLAKDEQELSEWGKRSDFIRWCSPDPKAMREQP